MDGERVDGERKKGAGGHPAGFSERPIGIFDSGVGGLAVARNVVRLAPREPFIYLADSGRFPYGPRPLEEVRRFTGEALRFFAEKGAKLVIIACNTATAAALGEALRTASMPVVGVIDPGSRAALAAHRTPGPLAILGTKATIESGAYPRALRGLGFGGETAGLACPDFVLAAESGEFEGPAVERMVADALGPLVERRPSTVILGCTHFAPLARVIAQAFGTGVAVVDPAEETAREALDILRRDGLQAPAAAVGGAGGLGGPEAMTAPFYRFFTSGDPEHFRAVASRLFGRPIERVEPVDLERY